MLCIYIFAFLICNLGLAYRRGSNKHRGVAQTWPGAELQLAQTKDHHQQRGPRPPDGQSAGHQLVKNAAKCDNQRWSSPCRNGAYEWEYLSEVVRSLCQRSKHTRWSNEAAPGKHSWTNCMATGQEILFQCRLYRLYSTGIFKNRGYMNWDASNIKICASAQHSYLIPPPLGTTKQCNIRICLL